MKRYVVIVIGFVSAVVAIILVWLWLASENDSLKHTSIPVPGDSLALAEYYFNQDVDPAGPYDLEKSRYYYEQSLLEDVQNTEDVLYQLGRIDFLEGYFDRSLYKFDRYIEYSDDPTPSVYYMLGLVYGYKARSTGAADDWQSAEQSFLKYLSLEPVSPWARTDLSWVYFSQGKYDQMIPVLEPGLLEHPDNPWLLNMYGLALLNTDRPNEAHDYFLKALHFAESLTEEEWGRSYPGNNPLFWGDGLKEFQDVITYNINLTI